MRRYSDPLMRDQQGAVAILVGLVLLPVFLLSMGVVVDYARAAMFNNKLRAATDAAVLSLARSAGALDYRSGEMQAELNQTFFYNFPRDYMGATDVSINLVPPQEANGVSTYSIRVSANLPMMVMDAFGQDRINQIVPATAIRRQQVVPEVALALDISPSMTARISGTTRLQALKDAVTAYAEVMYPNGSANVITNIVPYNAAVNIGTSSARRNWVKRSRPIANQFNNNYLRPRSRINCEWVFQGRPQDKDRFGNLHRLGPEAISGPGVRFEGYVFTREEYYNYHYYQSSRVMFQPPPLPLPDDAEPDAEPEVPPQYEIPASNSRNDRCARYPINSRSGFSFSNDLTDAAPSRRDSGRFLIAAPYMHRDLPEIAVGRRSARTVTSLVDSIQITAGDALTSINTGLLWAWNTLSPNWDWGGRRAASYASHKTNPKFLILMTDGVNTLFHKDSMDRHTASLCRNIKHEGITVYTIAFSEASEGSHSLLRNCASDISKFFIINDGVNLARAFENIADNILSSSIALTE